MQAILQTGVLQTTKINCKHTVAMHQQNAK